MALREFRDANGVEWRVWATIPETSALGRVDYGPLGGLEAGWLTFECAEGRRRLAPFPADWHTLTDAELERFCLEAKAPPLRRARTGDPVARNDTPPRAPMELSALDPSSPARTFTDAAGRSWRVTEHECVTRVASDDVAMTGRTTIRFILRFSSESGVFELGTYPMAWSRLSDAQLLRLAGHAERVTGSETGSQFQR